MKKKIAIVACLPRCVAQVLVPVSELRITDVGKAICFIIVPPMSKLRLPHEGQGTLNLVGDQLSNDVSGVDIDGTNCHDLLTVAACQRSQQQGDLK